MIETLENMLANRRGGATRITTTLLHVPRTSITTESGSTVNLRRSSSPNPRQSALPPSSGKRPNATIPAAAPRTLAVGWLRWCRQVTRRRHWRSSFWGKDSCWRKWERSRRRLPKKQERGLVSGTRFREKLINATCEVHALAKGMGQVVTETKTNKRVTSGGMIGTCTCYSKLCCEIVGHLGSAVMGCPPAI